MADAATSLPELEDMLQSVSAVNRPEILKHVVDLFLQNSDRLRPVHVEMFDAVISSLIADIATESLVVLSKRIAGCDKVPTKIAMRLASDPNISVAEPMLLESSRLTDAFLIDVAKTQGQMHILAVACRSQVSAAVTDVIIGRGDDVVVRYVVNNPGATFSDAGLLALVERSKGDAALAEQLTHRHDIRGLKAKSRAAG